MEQAGRRIGSRAFNQPIGNAIELQHYRLLAILTWLGLRQILLLPE